MKKLLPIIAGVVLLLCGAGGFFAYQTFLAGGGKSHAKGKQTPEQLAKVAEAKKRAQMQKRQKLRVDGPTVSLGDPLLVNLADPGLTHYVKLSVAFRVDKQTPLAKAAAEGGASEALADVEQVRDIVRADIQDFTAAQLVTRQGQERLKHRIEDDVASQTDTLPLAVYFPDLAVQ